MDSNVEWYPTVFDILALKVVDDPFMFGIGLLLLFISLAMLAIVLIDYLNDLDVEDHRNSREGDGDIGATEEADRKRMG